MFRPREAMDVRTIDRCHDGAGKLECTSVLQRGDSALGIAFMHDDIIDPGASIGEHLHQGTEELYYVVEGWGTMILDGVERPMGPGDVSLVQSGHTHGLINSAVGPMRLVVLEVTAG